MDNSASKSSHIILFLLNLKIIKRGISIAKRKKINEFLRVTFEKGLDHTRSQLKIKQKLLYKAVDD